MDYFLFYKIERHWNKEGEFIYYYHLYCTAVHVHPMQDKNRIMRNRVFAALNVMLRIDNARTSLRWIPCPFHTLSLKYRNFILLALK